MPVLSWMLPTKDHFDTIVLTVAAVYGLMKPASESPKELYFECLIVSKCDESHEIQLGLHARSLGDGPGGIWCRSRLIKGEIDDPFDDRFHAIELDGTLCRAPDHISWNV